MQKSIHSVFFFLEYFLLLVQAQAKTNIKFMVQKKVNQTLWTFIRWMKKNVAIVKVHNVFAFFLVAAFMSLLRTIQTRISEA